MQPAPAVPQDAPGAAAVSVRRGLYAVLCLAVFLEAVGLGMLFPLLARLQSAYHLPTYGLGIMSGAAFFSTLATQVGVAHMLDGPRGRLLLLAGLLVTAASFLWFAASSSLLALAASRAVGGVGYGIVMPAALKAGTMGVLPEQRGARLGRISSAQMAGLVLGPLAGTGLAAIGGLRVPFVSVGAAGLVVLAVVTGLTAGASRLSEAHAEGPEPSPLPARPSWHSRPVLALLILAVASQLPTGLYDALWSRLLTDRGASSLLIGLSLTLFGLPFVFLAPLGGRLAGRKSPLVWSGVSLLAAACVMTAYGVVTSPIYITMLGMVEAVAQSIAIPGGYAAAAAIFPDRWAATGQGWYSGAGTAAAGVSSLLGAPAYAAFGPGAVFGGGAALSAAFVLTSIGVWQKSGIDIEATAVPTHKNGSCERRSNTIADGPL